MIIDQGWLKRGVGRATKLGRFIECPDCLFLRWVNKQRIMIPSFTGRCSSCCKKQLLNPMWNGGKPSCIDCNQQIGWQQTRCRRCSFLKRRDELNHNWKGDRARYNALHNWVRLRLGNPSICINCGNTTAKKYDWSNISYQYKRILSDWERLCRSCHMKKDRLFGWGRARNKYPERRSL